MKQADTSGQGVAFDGEFGRRREWRRWRLAGMEGVLFMMEWVGGALLHTYYDLKIKPALRAAADEQTDYPGF